MEPLGTLVTRALSGATDGAPELDADLDAVGVRILDAALAEVAAHGTDGLTGEGVARRAKVSRVTVYRRFGDRQGLVTAMTMREGRRLAAGIAEAMAEARSAADQIVEGFVAAIRIARDHPVISRTARHEPGELIAAGVADDAALLKLGSALVADCVRALQDEGVALHVDADEAGETLARLFAAFVLVPSRHVIDLSSDESTRGYLRRTLAPMVTGIPPA